MVTPIAERVEEFVAEGEILTDVGGSLPFKVLSTPGMIAMMERTAAMLVFPLLEEGQVTVGFEVCIKHVGAAAEGQECVAHAELTEVIDGRKLRFDVEVKEGARTIGVGTHERRMISVSPEV